MTWKIKIKSLNNFDKEQFSGFLLVTKDLSSIKTWITDITMINIVQLII